MTARWMKTVLSPSSRRAWIEIPVVYINVLDPAVALLAEGVDRNSEVDTCDEGVLESPSSRRAWIEIRTCCTPKRRTDRRPPRGGRG